jgi:hypothetical protein
MAKAIPDSITIRLTLITIIQVQILPGGVEDILDAQLVQGPGKTEAPPGPSHGGNDSRLPQPKKDLLQKHGRNMLRY